MGQTFVESDLRFDAAADAVVRAEQRVEVGVVSEQLVLPVCCLKFQNSTGFSAYITYLYCVIEGRHSIGLLL